MDFRDAGRFVSLSGAASVVSYDAGKLTVVKTEEYIRRIRINVEIWQSSNFPLNGGSKPL